MSLRSAVRRVPAIARREAQIADLRAELDRVQTRLQELERAREALAAQLAEVRRSTDRALTSPSFTARVHEDRRKVPLLQAHDTDRVHPARRMSHKLACYELAASHGIAVPRLHGFWHYLDDIDWQSLPERFVFKTNGGASGKGVFPLRRDGRHFTVIDGADRFTAAELRRTLEERLARQRVRGPFFAEELLQPSGGDLSLPTDVKVYAFYGEVGHVLLRQVPEHGNGRRARWRYLDATGRDLGQVSRNRTVSPGVPVPGRLEELVAAARLLSRAVPVPFVRVDLYETAAGVVFGELTRNPGGAQLYADEHDRALGLMWEEATARLQSDLAGGRPYAWLHGRHPRDVVPDPPDGTS